MQTQTSNTLHNAIMEAGGKDRPRMLALGNYVQWKSKIKRYIDTKPNHELIHYCPKNPPYKFTWADKEVPISEGSSVTTTETRVDKEHEKSAIVGFVKDVEILESISEVCYAEGLEEFETKRLGGLQVLFKYRDKAVVKKMLTILSIAYISRLTTSSYGRMIGNNKTCCAGLTSKKVNRGKQGQYSLDSEEAWSEKQSAGEEEDEEEKTGQKVNLCDKGQPPNLEDGVVNSICKNSKMSPTEVSIDVDLDGHHNGGPNKSISKNSVEWERLDKVTGHKKKRNTNGKQAVSEASFVKRRERKTMRMYEGQIRKKKGWQDDSDDGPTVTNDHDNKQDNVIEVKENIQEEAAGYTTVVNDHDATQEKIPGDDVIVETNDQGDIHIAAVTSQIGLGAEGKTKWINELVDNNKPLILGLQETKMDQDNSWFFNTSALGEEGLLVVVGSWKGKEGLVGFINADFNEVRNVDERKNLGFNRRGENLFSNFITGDELVDISLGGKRFTRVSDDRPKPFRFFDVWLDDSECEKVVADYWKKEVFSVKADCWLWMEFGAMTRLVGRNWNVSFGKMRLKKVIDMVVGEEQNAFIKDKYILDGGLIANETVEFLKKKRKAFLLKIDFEKAQGDPLLPFLYLIAAEGLNITIGEAVSNGIFKGLSSGLKINPNKTKVYGIGVGIEEVTSLAQRMRCAAGLKPFTYLGLPVGGSMKRKAKYLRAPRARDFLLAILVDWLGQHMSPVEYRTILKYRLMISPFPVDEICPVCRKACLNSFENMWRAEISTKKKARVNFWTDPLDGRSTLRPADVLICGWAKGKHACIDLTGVFSLLGLSSWGFTVGCFKIRLMQSDKT
uniref:Putative reverse transcriptase domain-containing protein n=1 Tax=Tanacetum cinerariifolium TaxID=118510 RepID=A0A6L2N5V1_TANCI|nr:putative reverse transcriptase domain-containing protein [Tanacetum cinerariifolium]